MDKVDKYLKRVFKTQTPNGRDKCVYVRYDLDGLIRDHFPDQQEDKPPDSQPRRKLYRFKVPE